MKPVVSVLMPVYNAEKYVAKAIESILTQTFTTFELLIRNDGSTDNSLKILESYAARDPRIRLFGGKNRGIVDSTNELLQQAVGEFVAIMDSDDIALPDRFALQVKLLQAYPTVVGVGGEYILMDERERLLLRNSVPEADQAIQKRLLAGFAGDLLHPTAMIRRTALLKINGYRQDVAAAFDLDVFLRLGEVGQLANVQQMVLKYRIRSSSYSAEKTELYSQEAAEVCQQAWKRRGITGDYEAGRDGRIRHDEQDRESVHVFMLKYGWWGFNSGQRGTAIVYALKAILARPFRTTGWKLLLCSFVKRLPPPAFP